MTYCNEPHYLTLRHLTTNHIISSHLAASHITTHTASQHITSPPPTHQRNTTRHHQNATAMNGRKPVHTKTSVWASHWLVAVCKVYRHILSLAIIFFLLNFPPQACPLLFVQYISVEKKIAENWVTNLVVVSKFSIFLGIQIEFN